MVLTNFHVTINCLIHNSYPLHLYLSRSNEKIWLFWFTLYTFIWAASMRLYGCFDSPFTPLSEPHQWENMVVIYLNLLNSNNFIYLCCINSKINQNWRRKRNRVFATNSDFLIPISLKSDDVNLWYFKLSLFDQ